MGMILDDRDLGIHCEAHLRWGVDLYTDLGHSTIALNWDQIPEAIRLLNEALEYKREKNESLPTSTTEEAI